jgi:pimeloyl-ACP methyl ester carboxylesterase
MSIFTLARWLGPWASATKSPPAEVRDGSVGGLPVRTYIRRRMYVRTHDAKCGSGRARADDNVAGDDANGAGDNANYAAGDDANNTNAADADNTNAAAADNTNAAAADADAACNPDHDNERTFIIAPGLHYAGADDPRLDRFCRILAAAGHRVVAPFVPSYLALEPDQRAIDDFIRVVDALPRGDRKPVAFSISFGSLLAFAAAAERPDAFERLVVFGGYADFIDAMRFCLTGEHRDPLNQPVVVMNLLDHIEHDRAHTAALKIAWRQYVERTWGRPEMKAPERYLAIAAELAPTVPAPVRGLFMAGIEPGAWPLAEPALARADRQDLEPARLLARVHGRVDLVHGADDDVIPVEHVHRLARGLVNADVRVHVTGLYGHTGAGFGKLAALPRELVTMIRVLRVLS